MRHDDHTSIQEGCSESEKKSHVLRCAHDYDDCLLLRRKQRRKMYIVATSAAQQQQHLYLGTNKT